MKSNIALGRVALCAVNAALLAFACSDDNNAGEPTEAGTGGHNAGGSSIGGKGMGGANNAGRAGAGGTNAAGNAGRAGAGGTNAAGNAGSQQGGSGGKPPLDGGDGGPVSYSLCGGKTGQELVTCGRYIVEHIDACGDCHTPRLPSGAPDTTKILAGSPSFTDIDPTAGVGNIPAPNLTQLKRDGWTADDVMAAILDGKARSADGGTEGLFPAMPYVTFHNMAKEDAAAIAAYVLSLTYIPNDIPEREPLGGLENVLPVKPVAVEDIPDPVISKKDPGYAQAQFGKYLAAQVGVCLDCHTERKPNGEVDMAKAFAGGQTFELAPPFNTVYSANITPDPATGLEKTWTPDLIQRLLKTGKDDEGEPICPPMPVGPQGPFGGMTDEHALAIGAYITHLPPMANGPDAGGRFPMCVPPPPPDGGSRDAATD